MHNEEVCFSALDKRARTCGTARGSEGCVFLREDDPDKHTPNKRSSSREKRGTDKGSRDQGGREKGAERAERRGQIEAERLSREEKKVNKKKRDRVYRDER